MQLARRSFLLGLGASVAAPAVVHATSLMPISARLILPPKTEIIGAIKPIVGKIPEGWIECNGRWLSTADHSDLYAVIGNQYGGFIENYPGGFTVGGTFNVPNLTAQAQAECAKGNFVGRYAIYGGDQSAAHRRAINDLCSGGQMKWNTLPAEKQDAFFTY